MWCQVFQSVQENTYLKDIVQITLEVGKIMNGETKIQGFEVGILLKLFDIKSTKEGSSKVLYH
jgi:hypothetical protein